MDKVAKIKSRFLYGLLDQNTYVLSNGKEAVIIDAGAEIDDIKKIVGNAKVVGILMTHLHFDHFWNIDKYLDEFDADAYICSGAESKFSNPKENASFIVRQEIQKNIDKNRIKYYAKKLRLGDFNFDIIETPGHSTDSVCILYDDKLFVGDLIIGDSIGRTDLPGGDNEKIIESLKKIKSLDYTTLYSGHGEILSKNQVDKTISFYL